MSHSPQGNKADLTTLESRLSAARAGYLDNIDNATLKTLAAMRGTDGVDTAAMRGTDSAALASSWTAALATIMGNFTAARIGYMDAINRDRPDMLFPSASLGIVALPAVAADVDFPSVVVADLPSGLTIKRADLVLVIGALFDTSGAENQVDQAGKTIRIKKSTGAWGTDDIVALTFANTGLQTDADAYRGGPVLFGATDIKSEMDGNATYNLRTEESQRSEGVTVTGASLELLDVSAIIRVWFN